MLYNNSLVFIFFNFFKFNFFKKNSVLILKNNSIFIKYIPFFFSQKYIPFNENFKLLKNIIKINNNYFFFVNLQFALKLYKNVINLFYSNFSKNKNILLLNIKNIEVEVELINFFFFNTGFFNIYKILIQFFNKGKKLRSSLTNTINNFLNKYNINLLVLLDYNNARYYYNMSINFNLPIVSLVNINNNHNYLNFPIYVPSNNVLYKYLFLNEIINLYLLSKKNLQKKFIKKFIYFFLNNFIK